MPISATRRASGGGCRRQRSATPGAGSVQIESIPLRLSSGRMILVGEAVSTPGSGLGASFCRIILYATWKRKKLPKRTRLPFPEFTPHEEVPMGVSVKAAWLEGMNQSMLTGAPASLAGPGRAPEPGGHLPSDQPGAPRSDDVPDQGPTGPRTPYPVDDPGIGDPEGPGSEPDYLPGQPGNPMPRL